MVCVCKNCGEQVGNMEAQGCVTMQARFAVPLFVGSFVLPLLMGFSRHIRWEAFWPWLIAVLLLWGWLAFAMWFPCYYTWLKLTLLKPCPQCRKRRWTEGRFSGFGL